MAEGLNPELVHEIFKSVWKKTAPDAAAKADEAGSSKKSKSATANANALKLSCELLKMFVTEAVGRAGIIAEAEGKDCIEATHFERMLPQLLLDF